MGKRARRKQREAGLRKQPQQAKKENVRAVVDMLRQMDKELEECLSRTNPSTSE